MVQSPKACKWKDDDRTTCVDTECGHVVNQQPYAAIDYTRESYMGKGNQWKYCQFCGRPINVIEDKQNKGKS